MKYSSEKLSNIETLPQEISDCRSHELIPISNENPAHFLTRSAGTLSSCSGRSDAILSPLINEPEKMYS